RALHDGDVTTVAARIHAEQRAGASLAALCDGPIRRAMHAIGDLWQHDPDGIVIEHRATDACVQALASLRAAIPAPVDAPVALGGAPEDDPYVLPSAMVALVLALEGFRAVNLGADTPTAALHRAVAWHRPALVWISASAPMPLAQAHELSAFVTGLPPQITAGVGGRHAAEIADVDSRVREAASMTELVALARAALR
ncbi:MAG: B12-binding domain-containing protein, partial [Kofleriaceae bacterium]